MSPNNQGKVVGQVHWSGTHHPGSDDPQWKQAQKPLAVGCRV